MGRMACVVFVAGRNLFSMGSYKKSEKEILDFVRDFILRHYISTGVKHSFSGGRIYERTFCIRGIHWFLYYSRIFSGRNITQMDEKLPKQNCHLSDNNVAVRR
jgi:hypothetical protein